MAAEYIPETATDLDRAKMASKNRAKAAKMVKKAIEKKEEKEAKEAKEAKEEKENESYTKPGEVKEKKKKKPDMSAKVLQIRIVGSVLLTNIPRIIATWYAYCKNKERDTKSRYLLYNVWWISAIVNYLQGMMRSSMLGRGGKIEG